MSSSAAAEEKWQVNVGGQIYEADYRELTAWISENALLPQDKVRRGNLRWIEARKVPGLKTFFDAKEQGIEAPKLFAADDNQAAASNPTPASEDFHASSVESFEMPEDASSQTPDQIHFDDSNEKLLTSMPSPAGNRKQNYSNETDFSPSLALPQAVCSLHSDAAAEYFCATCGNHFCGDCPKSFGGNVKICLFCGAMCQSLRHLRERNNAEMCFHTATTEGFGAADLTRALAHPFQFKSSLFFGALLFAFFSIGQTAAAVGGFAMLGAALFCSLGANMLTFGVLANTVEKFSSGNTSANFMPDFDDFSILDDVVHPFFLSIGAYLSSFGPFILVCTIGAYLIFSSLTAQAGAMQKEIAKVPGTPAFDSQKAVEQSARVRQITESLRAQNDKKLERPAEVALESLPTDANGKDADIAEIERMIQDSRKAQIEELAGKAPEIERRETEHLMRGFLGLAAPLVVAGFLAFLWGAFYFPAACAVAGYTRSFAATINPLVGLDTIRRLGLDYVKVLLMSFSIIIAAVVAGLFLNVIFAPFDLPRIGNLPLTAVGSVFTFYFSIVFSCVIGFALYKNAAKLNLPRG